MVEQVSFIGRLVEIPSASERCGDNAVAVVYKFTVIETIRGKINQESMLIIIPCPDLKVEGFFVKNARYQIDATNDLSEAEDYMTVNNYADEYIPLFWGQTIEKIN